MKFKSTENNGMRYEINMNVQLDLHTDPILRELVEETIVKSHRGWRSIPETAVLVLKAIEDYGVGK